MSKTTALVDDGSCIACGPDSDIGLRMRFERDAAGSVQSGVSLPATFQGWRGVAHGGVVALLLDEAMAYAAASLGVLGVTAQLTMRFHQEVPLNQRLLVRGNVCWRRRRLLAIEASVSDAAGTVLASGAGRFIARGTVEAGTRLDFTQDGYGCT